MVEPDDAPAPEQACDRTEFDAFFARHEQALYGYLCRLLASEEVAAEVAQEAFFRAWIHFEKIKGYDQPTAWLYRVATNLATSALRRRQPIVLSRLVRRFGDDSPDEPIDDLPNHALAVEDQAVERDIISRALNHLVPRERAALLLRSAEGFSHEEVAAALGISVSNARQVATRARMHFRAAYEAELAHVTND